MIDSWIIRHEEGFSKSAKRYRAVVVEQDNGQVLVRPRYNYNVLVWLPINSNQIEMPNDTNDSERYVYQTVG